jgi:uncharacterized membrane protein YvlD (DUF360 family)
MVDVLNHWILQTIAMGIAIFLIPRISVTSIFGPLIMVMGLALFNAFLWDENLFFFIPTDLGTRTLVILLINGVAFWVLVKILPGIECTGILPALIAPLVFTIVNALVFEYGREIDWGIIGDQIVETFRYLKERVDTMGPPTPTPTPH